MGHAEGRGHSGVFERAGGIHALVLGKELVHSKGAGGTRQGVERGVALAQGDGIAKAVQDGKQLAEAPDAGVVECLGGTFSFAPEPLERAGIGPVGIGRTRAFGPGPAWILDLEEIAAFGAAEVRARGGAGDARTAAETAQLMQIVVHAC